MKKICIITGSRAEYYLLYNLMKNIADDPELEIQIVVTGMHLSPQFGMTYQQILQDNFTIAGKVEMLLSSNSSVSVAKSMGLGIIGFADIFENIKPDLVVFLGDRYEILAAAQAAMIANIPLAHICGGEVTEGAVDEAIRHSLTKMSHLHFASAEIYRKRIIQLGENPERVFNVGAIGLDNIRNVNFLSAADFEKQTGFVMGEKNFLVTYHPETLGKLSPTAGITELLRALDAFPDANILFTMANADVGGELINRTIQNYVEKNSNRAFFIHDLGSLRYLSAVKLFDAVIGNSSSGIIEVPTFGKPTINIGNRQTGRIRAASIIDCEADANAIIHAIEAGLSSDFQLRIQNMNLPYGNGGVSQKIVDIIKKMTLKDLLVKRFYDLV